MQKIRLLSLFAMLIFGGLSEVIAQYNSINIDYQTAAVMAAEYNAAAAAEMYYDEQVKDILEKYGIAEVAAAGIYTSKHLDRKALTSLGDWSSASENYYYRRIYSLVSAKIIPELWDLSSLLLHYPHKAMYWGTYLVKTTTEVKNLCQQFESIVTNSTLSFSDINFLEVNPQLAALVQLTKIGDVDWKSMLHSWTYIYSSMTKENLKNDVSSLYEMGSQLATSGFSEIVGDIMGSSSFDGSFREKITNIYNVVTNVYDIYESADGDIMNVLQRYWGDNPTAADIFSFSSYDMTSWISDYLSMSESSYYTQRYYIAKVDRGSQVVCNYSPPTDNNSVINGSEWTRFETSDPGFWPSSSQLEQALTNSERYAGWSRSMVTTLNGQNTGDTYSIISYPLSYIITRGGRQTKKAFAYEITVTKSWYREEVVYEEIFDSYSMDLATFTTKMNGYLAEYNDNDEGVTYQLLSDPKQFYEVATEAKVKGCESAIITVTCTEDVSLGDGSTQWKCNTCGSSLNSHSKECAMRTTLSSDDYDQSDRNALLQKIEDKQKEVDDADDLLSQALEQQEYLEGLLEEMTPGTTEYISINSNLQSVKSQVRTLRNRKQNLESELARYEDALEEMDNDPVETDDYYRIPAIMQEVQGIYRLSWQGEGWWSGYTYYRLATSPLLSGTLTFSATLSIARKPSFFLGIKIHRAILKISWSLTATYTDTQVVDNIQLDPDMEDSEKTEIINKRLAEIARDFPGCRTSVEYIKSEDDEVEDDTDDTYHLLWSSDRLAIARQVEARLMNIYADIVSMKKMLRYQLSVVDVIRGALPYVNDEQGRRMTLIERCRRRWLKNAADRHHSLGYNGKYDYDEETEDTP